MKLLFEGYKLLNFVLFEQVNIVMNLCGLVMEFVVDICRSWLELEVWVVP